MVAAAKSAHRALRTAQVYFVGTSEGADVRLFRQLVGSASYGKARGDSPPDKLVELHKLHVLFPDKHSLHAAADVNAHKVGDNFVGDGHGGADNAANACMDIGHHSYFLADSEFLAAKLDYLGDRGAVDIIGKNLCCIVFSL